MKKSFKISFILFVLCLSFSLVSEAESYGVFCEKGFQEIGEKQLQAFFIEQLEDPNAVIKKITIDKLRDQETGEVILFIKVAATLSSGQEISILNQVYESGTGAFSLNPSAKEDVRFVYCKSNQKTAGCTPQLSSEGQACLGADCLKVSVSASPQQLCK